MRHELKVWPDHFAEIVSGAKRADVRATTDRQFSVGDSLHFRCWHPREGYTGETADARVTAITTTAGPLRLMGIDEPWLEEPPKRPKRIDLEILSEIAVLSIQLEAPAGTLGAFLRYITDNYAAIYIRAEHTMRPESMSLAELPPAIAAAWVKTFIERWSVDSSYLPTVVL
jgi:uncharacterized protein DUF3850